MTDYSEYRRHYATEQRIKLLISQEKCPVCELLLASRFHTDCPYLKVINRDKS